MSRRTWRKLGGAAGLSTLLVATWGPAGPAWAEGHGGHAHSGSGHTSGSAAASSQADKGGAAPAGNNGTVKVNDEASPNQDNDAHVGCNFSVSFYGYDTGNQTGQLSFAGQAPTRGSGSVTLSASWTTADRTGGNQLDRTVPVSFSQLAGIFKGVAPAHRGYHVKLTATVSGSQGSDVKHKVFWIDCPPAPTSSGASPSGSGTGSSSTGAGPSSAPAASGAGTPPAAAASGATPPAVATASGVTPAAGLVTPFTAVEGLTLVAPATAASSRAPGTVTAAAAGAASLAAPGSGPAALPPARPGAAVAGSTLAFTGFQALGMAGLGTGLLAGGSALAILGRRRRRG
ncbi:MAG TPA: hypothetical protein VFH50_12595 [Acidimicrobiales bacterium]|nr:hypothetical protein [Acidimicrobiales bacterium]